MNLGEKQKKKLNELIEDYQKAVSQYTLENKELEQKINDLKTTLNLNQNLLYDYIIKSTGENEEVKNLVNNTKKIWEETELYIEQKNLFELKIARLQSLIEDTPTKIREEINEITIKNNKTQEEISEKDKIINHLKKELDKTRKNALFKNARTEVYVTDPTKANIETGQELLSLKTILSKITPIHTKKMEDSEIIKQNLDELKEKLNLLIEKAYNIYTRLNHKKSVMINNKYNKDDLNNFCNMIEGYDIDADKSEEEEEDDDDDILNNKGESDSEEEEINSKKKLKIKERELDKLTEQYRKLKEECQDYENKINEHKKIYKDIKIKMKNLKESVGNDY